MNLICFGDSNTYGYDPRSPFADRYAPENRWVDLLGKATGWKVINLGENGREIPHHSHELQTAAELVAKLKPEDVLLVMLGTNDLLMGLTPEQVGLRMETFLLTILSLGRRLILVTPPPMKRGAWVERDELVAASARLGEIYRDLGKSLAIELVDTATWALELAFDGVHFTEMGHHVFGNRMTQRLRTLLD